LTTFSFEIIYLQKITFEFLSFEIQIFQTTSDGEMNKTKVVDLKKSTFLLKSCIQRKLRLNFLNLKFNFLKQPQMEK